jgi:hypothetical protein
MHHCRILSTPTLASLLITLASAQTGYIVDSDQDILYSIDLVTANVTMIGSTLNNGLGTPAGLAWRADLNELWTVDLAGGEVGPIDVTNGTFTPVLQTNLSGWQGIAWDESRSVFVLANQDDSNYELDPVSGITTLLGNSGFPLITAIDFDPAGVLWGVDFGGTIVSIDTTTGAGTPTTATSTSIQGLAIDNSGTWYAVDTNTDSLYTIDPVSGGATLIGVVPGVGFVKGFEIPTSGGSPSVGVNYCTANVNSTGQTGLITGSGSASVAANNLTIEASRLPNNAFGYFLTSLSQASTPNPGGSLGILCLGGSIGRYTGPGQIQNTGATGAFSLLLNLNQVPTPTGFVAAVAGETRNFQAWHRDSVGGAAVSNFTNGLEVTFN